MAPTRESITTSVRLVLDNTDKAEVANLCTNLIDVLGDETLHQRSPAENEEYFLDDLNPETLTNPQLYAESALWKATKAAISLLFT